MYWQRLRLPFLPVTKEVLHGKMLPACATRASSLHLVGKTRFRTLSIALCWMWLLWITKYWAWAVMVLIGIILIPVRQEPNRADLWLNFIWERQTVFSRHKNRLIIMWHLRVPPLWLRESVLNWEMSSISIWMMMERLLMPTVVIVVAPGPRCKCHWYSMQNGRTSISVWCGMVSSAIRYTTYPAGKDVCLQTTPTISVLKRVKNLTR